MPLERSVGFFEFWFERKGLAALAKITVCSINEGVDARTNAAHEARRLLADPELWLQVKSDYKTKLY